MSFSSPPLKRPVKRRSLKRCMSSPSCSLRSQNGQDVEPTKVLKGREVWDQPKCLRVGDCEPKQSANGWRNLRATEVPMGQETCIELCQRERQSCKISLTCATQSRMMNVGAWRFAGSGDDENTLSFGGLLPAVPCILSKLSASS